MNYTLWFESDVWRGRSNWADQSGHGFWRPLRCPTRRGLDAALKQHKATPDIAFR
jgi:hypothetical protein